MKSRIPKRRTGLPAQHWTNSSFKFWIAISATSKHCQAHLLHVGVQSVQLWTGTREITDSSDSHHDQNAIYLRATATANRDRESQPQIAIAICRRKIAIATCKRQFVRFDELNLHSVCGSPSRCTIKLRFGESDLVFISGDW